MPHKILFVDDEPDLRILVMQKFRSGINKGELEFDFALNGAEALEKALVTPYEIIFTDINMPVMDGLTLLNELKEKNVHSRAVVISAYSEIGNIRVAMNRGAFDFITKPIDLADLETTMLKALQAMEVLRQGLEARENLLKTTIEKEEAQRQALENLQEKERLILYQNEMLERQVAERTAEVRQQKELVEMKNREILDSIHYARHVQEALMPQPGLINDFFTDSFILYEAKDIVAGDFYWLERLGGRKLIATADCTGHGVAGALMSMIGISLLTQLVMEKGLSDPAPILDQLHTGVITALRQAEGNSHDGMDIVLCAFEDDRLFFAGANRPLWLIRNNALVEYPGTKLPVGGLQILNRGNFIQHEIRLEKGDVIYMFTDGYADQFGGAEGKKLMTKKFRETLLSIHAKPMAEQQLFLRKMLRDWQGINDQVDDVLVMGIRYS